MKRVLIIIPILLFVIGCAFLVYRSQQDQYQERLKNGRPDITDRDFVATISPTSKPMIFLLHIKRVNKVADKKIGSFGLLVDFILTDSNDKVFAAKPGDWGKYVEGIAPAFEKLRPVPVDSFSGNVKIITKGLKPGKYSVKPYVRINEVGKDALRGPYTDGGSVAVAAGNKITVEIR